jgi:putative hydrolase of the HAD superfamily
VPISDIPRIEAILFDMNGTLRVREAHEQTQRAAYTRLEELIGNTHVDWNELASRQKTYSNWAQVNLIQLSEAEIWSRWILPEHPLERIEPVAAELTLAWGERKGHAVPVLGAQETLVELKRRGYRLGIISNSMSTLDIPHSLQSFGWEDYFDVVILSSTLKIRKPSPEPFLEAAHRMNLSPQHCAYLGNRISKDIPGCKEAGFALGIIIEPSGVPRADEQDQTVMPDAVIYALSELLKIFPSRS